MDVQLRRDVAELGDIELAGGSAQGVANGAHRRAGLQHFVHQDIALAGLQILQLIGRGAARQEHNPWKARVGLQADMAQRQVAERLGGGQEGRVDLEHNEADHAPRGPPSAIARSPALQPAPRWATHPPQQLSGA